MELKLMKSNVEVKLAETYLDASETSRERFYENS